MGGVGEELLTLPDLGHAQTIVLERGERPVEHEAAVGQVLHRPVPFGLRFGRQPGRTGVWLAGIGTDQTQVARFTALHWPNPISTKTQTADVSRPPAHFRRVQELSDRRLRVIRRCHGAADLFGAAVAAPEEDPAKLAALTGVRALQGALTISSKVRRSSFIQTR
jgi:hypothetical protein